MFVVVSMSWNKLIMLILQVPVLFSAWNDGFFISSTMSMCVWEFQFCWVCRRHFIQLFCSDDFIQLWYQRGYNISPLLFIEFPVAQWLVHLARSQGHGFELLLEFELFFQVFHWCYFYHVKKILINLFHQSIDPPLQLLYKSVTTSNLMNLP